jgi:hypothetical protein
MVGFTDHVLGQALTYKLLAVDTQKDYLSTTEDPSTANAVRAAPVNGESL